MPQIAIDDVTLARLQKHAVPLIDTFDTVINRIFDAYEAHNGNGDHAVPSRPAPVARTFEASSPPDLTHTKVLSAKLDGSTLAKRSRLERTAEAGGNLQRGAPRAQTDPQSASSSSTSRTVSGRAMGMSIWLMPTCPCRVRTPTMRGAAYSTSRSGFGISVEVVFMWRHKEKAAFPGKTGRLAISPK